MADSDFMTLLNNDLFRNEEFFKQELLKYLEVDDNPKADELYSVAWELGHSYGFQGIYDYACDIVRLIK